MKALAVAVLFVSFACLASAATIAELATAGVEAGRNSTLMALRATDHALKATGLNIVQDVRKSNQFIHSAVEVCRKAVDGGFDCCCAAVERVHEFADDGVLRCRAAVAQCTHAACTAIDGVLDGPAAAAAKQVVETVGLVADKGFDLAVASHKTSKGLSVRGLDLAQKGTHLALNGVDVAADVGLLLAKLGVVGGAVGADVTCWAGRVLVNTVADDHINLINAVDNALGRRLQRPAEGGHAHEE